MGIVEDFERIDMGKNITNWKTGVQTQLTRIDAVFAQLVQAKAVYPADATEIDGYIAQLKTAMQNVVNKY